jgi:hypothetical protein
MTGDLMTTPIQAFRANEANDDGRDTRLIGYFREEAGAKLAAKKRGGYGDGNVHPVMALPADDGKFYILAEPDAVTLDVDLIKLEAEARKAALAKLTPEEIALLKIKV